jgi:hypothetical protein
MFSVLPINKKINNNPTRGNNNNNENDKIFAKNVKNKTTTTTNNVCIALIDIEFCLYNKTKHVNNINILSNGKLNNIFNVQAKKRNDKKKDVFNFTYHYLLKTILKTQAILCFVLKKFLKILEPRILYKYDDIKI